MPPRSKILSLPDAVRSELERRLIAGGFADYSALSEWLSAQGYAISRAAVHRYGSAFERRVDALRLATRQARAVVEATPDDTGAMNEAMLRLMQERVFGLLLELELGPGDEKKIAQITRAVADLARAGVAQKKFEQMVRERAASAADEAVAVAREGGLSDEAAELIRSKILGIAS